MTYAVIIDPAYLGSGVSGPVLDPSITEWVKAYAPRARTVELAGEIKLHFAERKLAESFLLGFI